MSCLGKREVIEVHMVGGEILCSLSQCPWHQEFFDNNVARPDLAASLEEAREFESQLLSVHLPDTTAAHMITKALTNRNVRNNQFSNCQNDTLH